MLHKKLFPVSIRLAVHVHATEDEEKVLLSIKNIMPEGVEINLKKHVYSGYYGNQIIRFEGLISNQKLAKLVFRYIFSGINGLIYPGWIIERFDKKTNTLFLRLDKQEAYLGKIILGWGDDIIHLAFKFPGFLKIDAEELEKFIEGLRSVSEEL